MPVVDVDGELGLVVDEPAEVAGEARERFERARAQRRDRAQRQQPDHRSHAQRDAVLADPQHVVVEAVVLVPQAAVVDGGGDVGEVLEELRARVLVGG
jgi:hypothetical protein